MISARVSGRAVDAVAAGSGGLTRHKTRHSGFAIRSRYGPRMGGSRKTERDIERVARQITGADLIVDEARRQRCAEAIETWRMQISAWRTAEPSPVIGVALIAGYYWLDVYCEGCRQVATLDLRKVNRHERTKLANLTLGLRCTRCTGGYGPMARIVGISNAPPETVLERHFRVRRERGSQ